MRIDTADVVRLPSLSVRVLRDVLAENRLDPLSAFEEAGINPTWVDKPTAELNGLQQMAFQRAFVRQTTGREELWVAAAARHGLQILGLLGLAFWTAPDLEAWCRVLAFSDFHYGLTRHEILRDADGHAIGIEVRYDSSEDLREFSQVLDVASVMRGLDALWGGPFPFRDIDLPAGMTPACVGRRPHANVTDSCNPPRLTWSARTSRQALPGTSPLVHQNYVARLKVEFARLRDSVDPVQRVRLFLELPGNAARPVAHAASHLGVSVRTLQRRLGECGLQYRELQDAAKRSRARALVASTPLCFSQVAAQLGYSEPSSFTRAFVAWFGETPSTHRRRNHDPARDAFGEPSLAIGAGR